jgi:ABC-2 type transport system ATP-binding protein
VVGELRRAGTTVLLTTQYLEEADRLAQRIALIDHGRIAAEGTAAELKAAIGRQLLVVRLAEPGRSAGAARRLADLSAAEEPLVDAAAGEIRLPVADPAASAEAIRRLDEDRAAIAAIELRQPSLDDVFLTLTGRPAAPEPDRPLQVKEAA